MLRLSMITANSAEEWFGASAATCLDQIPVACVDLDRDGLIRRTNAALFHLLGYEESAILGRPVWDLIVPEEMARARRGYAQKLAGERHLIPFERDYLRADGTVVTVQVHDLKVLDRSGAAVGIRSGLVDVSARKLQEIELQAETVFARALLGAMPGAMIVTDALGSVTSLNPAAERLIGKPERESIGHSLENVLGLSVTDPAPGDPTVAPDGLLSAVLSSDRGVTIMRCQINNRIADLTLSCIVDDTQTILGFLANVR